MARNLLLITTVALILLAHLATPLSAASDPPPADDDAHAAPSKNLPQSHLKFYLLTTIFVVLGAFLFFLLTSLIRMNRLFRYRLRIGRRSFPTEPFDAWTDYRLPDDYDNDSDNP